MRRARKTLYVVRHGNTFDKGDVVRRIGARTDLPLSASGRDQAAALAHHFCTDGVVFDFAFSSPLLRARETAAAILAASPVPVELKIDEALTEIDYGPDENMPETAVVERLGAAALAAWDADAVPPPGWRVDVDALQAGWRAVIARLSQLEAETALAVTSNGVARFLFGIANAPAGAPRKLRTGAFGRVRLQGEAAAIEAWDIRP